MDDGRTELRSLLAKNAGSGGVDRVREIRLGLGFIDSGVGSGAENDIRLGRAHGGADRVGT